MSNDMDRRANFFAILFIIVCLLLICDHQCRKDLKNYQKSEEAK